MADKMTAHAVRCALWRHFTPRWAVVFEVTARTSRIGELADVIPAEQDRERRIDALLVRRASRPVTAAQRRELWNAMIAQRAREREEAEAAGTRPLFPAPAPPLGPPAETAANGGIERLAIEIKVSRGDFLADVKDPSKQQPWRVLAERHAYCTPAGMISRDEVPAGSGLLEISPGGTASWVRKAPRSTTPAPLPLDIQLDAFYRWARAEARTRGIDYDGRRDGDDVEALRAELARLRAQADLMERQRDRDLNAIAVWKARYGQCAPPPCGTCGRPLRPDRKGMGYGIANWVHAPTDELACHPLRLAASKTIYISPPEPAASWDDAGEPAEVGAVL